ncbi:MAG: HPr kinase/phosphorylase [Lentimonas sp.]|jgi:HPr kinase/phosphorylase
MPLSQKNKAKIVQSISVREFYDSFKDRLQLELVAGEAGLDKAIQERSLNRPAAALTGYFKFFAWKRIQLFGAGEMGYLRDLEKADEAAVLKKLFELKVPCLIISRHLKPSKTMKVLADQFSVPIIRSVLSSKELTTEATLLMEEKFAPQVLMHGTLLDIRGVGTLICGESGVGKSECALALIERGHSLVADDLTYIKRLSDNELVGNPSELSRGYMECRGLGIINIAELFGIRSVRLKKRIDLVINFINWNSSIYEDRTGLDEKFEEILGINVPLIEILVRPGRDMARLVEVASMMQAFKQMGHDSASEFNERLIAHISAENKKK